MIRYFNYQLLTLFFIFFSTLMSAQKVSLKRALQEIIQGKNATIAVSVSGIEDAFELNINAHKKLPLLSVFKFHIGLAVLDQVDQGKLKLDQKILITKEELLQNTWSPIREKYPNGNIELCLSEILYYTVAQSDNNGCDILLKIIGGTEVVQQFINGKGIQKFQIKANEQKMHEGFDLMYLNWTTTRSSNELLKKFYQEKIVSKKTTDFLMKIILETNTGANKIVAQLPKGTPVAHKTGASGKNEKGLTIAENDIGLITLPNGKHYAISIFVSDSMESDATNVKIIADISKKVWDYFTK